MGIFNFKNKNKTKSSSFSEDSDVSKLIRCTELATNSLLEFIPVKEEREIELYLFSQWITMLSAIANNIDSSIMDEFYINSDVKWMKERGLEYDYGPKLSEVRVHRFNEYAEFDSVVASLFNTKNYDTSKTIKLSRIAFTNLLGDDAYNHLLAGGPMLPIKLQAVMLEHGLILG